MREVFQSPFRSPFANGFGKRRQVGGAPAGLVLTGPLSITEVDDEGTGSYSANQSARHYWSLTAPADLPTQAEIVAGTDALDYGFYDADADEVPINITFTSGIDVTAGVLSIVAHVEPDGEWSDILRDEDVDVNTVVSLASHVVTFDAASTDGLNYTITPNSLFTAARMDTGMWFAASWYYDGTNGIGAIVDAADNASNTSYISLQCGAARWRFGGGSEAGSTDMGVPAGAGWQCVVGFLRKATTTDAQGHRSKVEFWRNGTEGTEFATATSGTMTEAANWNRVGVGHIPRLTPNLQFAGEVAEIAIGLGRPTSDLSTWLYNGGAFGRHVEDYDFTTAGLTLLDVLDCTALNPVAELANTDTGLQSTNGLLVSPTLVGRTTSGTGPQWKSQLPPSEG